MSFLNSYSHGVISSWSLLREGHLGTGSWYVFSILEIVQCSLGHLSSQKIGKGRYKLYISLDAKMNACQEVMDFGEFSTNGYVFLLLSTCVFICFLYN